MEQEDAQEQVKREVEVLRKRFRGLLHVHLRSRDASRNSGEAEQDLDTLSTADVLIAGKSQFGAMAMLLQKETGDRFRLCCFDLY